MQTNRLESVFEIISFFDEIRWDKERLKNKTLIAYLHPETITEDDRILTHWLRYITNRQMAYRILWDTGGYVISEIIHEIKKQNSLSPLNPAVQNSFVEKDVEKNSVIKFGFSSKSTPPDFPIDYVIDGKVKFKSRFFPSDYIAMLNTLVVLQDFEFSLSKYIAHFYQSLHFSVKDDFIRRILFCLFLLTYYENNQPKSEDLQNFEENLKKAKERYNEIMRILNDADKFENEFQLFEKDKIFNQKRAWCSLRDFLKHPEFKEYFKHSLLKTGLNQDNVNHFFDYKSLAQLELPGDVWNNNPKFRKCVLTNTEYDDNNKKENRKEALNKILRDYYEKNPKIKELKCYPEQFDVTFDIAARMCEADNCDICPLSEKPNNFLKICINNPEKFCPLVLIACNYHFPCMGEKCKLIKIINNKK